MQREELLQYWGTDNLRRWQEECISTACIPASAKEFLTSVGLPSVSGWLFRFDREADNLPTVANLCGYRRIGYDDLFPICLSEEKGEVFWVDEEMGSTRFINSNVEHFAVFLTLYRQLRITGRSLPQVEGIELVTQTEQKMMAVDPKAFSHEEHFWPVIFEQIRDGLL